MIRLATRLYDFMASHKSLCFSSLLVITLLLVVSLCGLEYKEDISDFLPASGNEKEVLSVYQDISSSDRIIAVFGKKGAVKGEGTENKSEAENESESEYDRGDYIVEAINTYREIIENTDSLHLVRNIVFRADIEKYEGLIEYVYSNIPYFLSAEDYIRMDTLLRDEGYISRQLASDKAMLMLPSSSMLSVKISWDPLSLFDPVLKSLQQINRTNLFETYDGYIFTPGMEKAVVMMSSPFGGSETKNNTHLVEYITSVADSVKTLYPDISISYTGAPVIAVGNARQIKNDSILSVTIALILILLLLSYAFRRVCNLFLILLSILWGWIFAMGMLAVVRDSISLIVVGISSIILGIAINYPLHLIAHLSSTSNVRDALKEVASPLIIGNITTIGAFMALIPLDAVALRDLGLFSTFLLFGTILFVMAYLPHLVRKGRKRKEQREEGEKRVPFGRIENITFGKTSVTTLLLILLTVVFGYFSRYARFNSDISNINYMTEEQREELRYFGQLVSSADNGKESIYVVSKGASFDEALSNGDAIRDSLSALLVNEKGEKIYSCSRFITSNEERERRIQLWNGFIARHRERLVSEFEKEALKEGFVGAAFAPYLELVQKSNSGEFGYDETLLKSIFASYLSADTLSGSYRVIDILSVEEGRGVCIEREISDWNNPYCLSFSVKSMNSALANRLSDNFNYIGWACGLIVFFFLWLSFGKIELALLSFLPMAVSWIWILGIMGLTGIEFNIVNIILATFIFGQGDDYTIFIAEGCCYEYGYRKRLLESYKSSIIISALIMFIGIGTLIFAGHPALNTLAQVTIIGMFSVVLMAFTLPPIVFNWIVKSRGRYRYRPLTLSALMRSIVCGVCWIVQLLTGYITGVLFYIAGAVVGSGRELRSRVLVRLVSIIHKIDQKLIPGVEYTLRNPYNEDFTKPAIIVCNHQSMLDPMCLMALSHKIRIVANTRSSHNPVIRFMFRWLGFYTIERENFTAWQDSSLERDLDIFRNYIASGYSIAVFPEGARSANSAILRYRKGAFYLAHELNVDILPVIIHGMNNIMPLHSFMSHPGPLTVCIEKRITPSSSYIGSSYSDTTRLVHKLFIARYEQVCKEIETTSFYARLLLERYMYKGADIYREVKRNMKKFHNYTCYADNLPDDITSVYILNSGLGELALMVALVNPKVDVIACEMDEQRRTLAFYSAQGVVSNLKYESSVDFESVKNEKNIIIYDTDLL